MAMHPLPVQARMLRRRSRRLPGVGAPTRDWLEQLERTQPPEDELLAMLAYVAREQVTLPEEELAAARRRAIFVHASGGGLERELTLDAPAGERLAADLDTAERRAELGRALGAMRDEAARLPHVRAALGKLLGDIEFAWRVLSIALLAEELANSES
jgi:hypothetical protein